METPPELNYDGHEISFIDELVWLFIKFYFVYTFSCFSVLDNEADISGDDDEQEEEEKEILHPLNTSKPNEVDPKKQIAATVESNTFYWSFSNLNFFDDKEYENYQKRNNQRVFGSNMIPWDGKYSSLTAIYEANKNLGDDNLISYNMEDFKRTFDCEPFYDWESSVEEQKQLNDSEYFIETVSTEEKAGRELYPVFERFVSEMSLKPMLLKHLYYFCKVFWY